MTHLQVDSEDEDMSFAGRGLSVILPTVYFTQVNFPAAFLANFKVIIVCVCVCVQLSLKKEEGTQKADGTS